MYIKDLYLVNQIKYVLPFLSYRILLRTSLGRESGGEDCLYTYDHIYIITILISISRITFKCVLYCVY